VRVGYEGVPDPQRHDLAAGAGAEIAAAVVPLLGGVGGPAAAVVGGGEVARGVVGVVVVVEEVPAGDVVHEAVAVGVRAVGEGRDQVLGVDGVLGAVGARVGVHAAVADVVEDVEGAVAVGVVRVRLARLPLGAGWDRGGIRARVRAVVERDRELAGVQ